MVTTKDIIAFCETLSAEEQHLLARLTTTIRQVVSLCHYLYVERNESARSLTQDKIKQYRESVYGTPGSNSTINEAKQQWMKWFNISDKPDYQSNLHHMLDKMVEEEAGNIKAVYEKRLTHGLEQAKKDVDEAKRRAELADARYDALLGEQKRFIEQYRHEMDEMKGLFGELLRAQEEVKVLSSTKSVLEKQVYDLEKANKQLTTDLEQHKQVTQREREHYLVRLDEFLHMNKKLQAQLDSQKKEEKKAMGDFYQKFKKTLHDVNGQQEKNILHSLTKKYDFSECNKSLKNIYSCLEKDTKQYSAIKDIINQYSTKESEQYRKLRDQVAALFSKGELSQLKQKVRALNSDVPTLKIRLKALEASQPKGRSS
tara:strand:+ start:28678 stop:29790 length:1113 start_codon:yes stop_codon:yes gene_type:complete